MAVNTATESERAIVLAEGERRGWPRAELDASISIESGWDPHISNPSTNAGGLIGFMPFVLKNLGWKGTPEAFRAQSTTQQAPWVGKYLDSIPGKWRVPGDTYLALAASGHVGAPDGRVIYPKGSKAWEQNPGWRPKGGGDITAGSIRAVVLRRMAGAKAKTKADVQPRSDVLPIILAAVLVYQGWKWWRKRKRRR